jgi:hypothetical protein
MRVAQAGACHSIKVHVQFPCRCMCEGHCMQPPYIGSHAGHCKPHATPMQVLPPAWGGGGKGQTIVKHTPCMFLCRFSDKLHAASMRMQGTPSSRSNTHAYRAYAHNLPNIKQNNIRYTKICNFCLPNKTAMPWLVADQRQETHPAKVIHCRLYVHCSTRLRPLLGLPR